MTNNPTSTPIQQAGALCGKRRDVLFLLSVTLAAIAIRFVAIFFRGDYLGWDEVMYLVMGKNLLTGHGYQLNGPPSITFPPMPGIIAAAVWMLTGSTRWAFSGPTAVLGGLATVPLFLLARRMFSRAAAYSAAVIFAGLFPLLVFSPFSTYKMRFYSGSEHVLIFFISWAMYFFYRAWTDRRILHAALGGLFCGLAFQARQEALVLFGALVAWLAVVAVISERRVTLNLAGRLAASAALFAAMSAPFFVYTRSVTGHFALGPHLSHNLALRKAFQAVYYRDDWRPFFQIHHSLNAAHTEFENPYYGVTQYHRDMYASQGSGESLTDVFAGLDIWSLKLWLKDLLLLLPRLFLPFLIVGCFERPSWQWAARLLFLAAVMTPAALIASTLLVLPRYNIYSMSILAVFGGAGVATVARLLSRFTHGRTILVATLIGGVIAATGSYRAVAFNARTRRDLANSERRLERIVPAIAAELRSLAAPGVLVIAHAPQAVFAAGDIWMPMPTDDFDAIVDFARHKNVRLILLRKGDGGMRSFTFDEALARTDLVSVLLRGEFDGEPMAILAVLPAEAGD